MTQGAAAQGHSAEGNAAHRGTAREVAPPATPISEALVRRAASSLADARALDAARALARAEGAAPLPNPELGFERQQSFAPNAQAQDILVLEWPIRLGGHGGERSLAQADAASAEAAHARLRLVLLREATTRFYRALHAERVATLRRAHESRVRDAARVVQAREAEGDASGLERMRAELALELARSACVESQLEAETLRIHLTRSLRLPVGPLRGDFRASPRSLNEALSVARERNDLRALEARVAHAERASDHAPRAAWPELRLRAGYNRQSSPGAAAGHGYALGGGLSLPLFDRGQALRGETGALAAHARAQLEIVRATVDAEVRASHSLLRGRLRERERFSASDVERLVDATLAAYRQGEARLLDVLDARRAALEVALRQAALDLSVREADVRLRAATGSLG